MLFQLPIATDIITIPDRFAELKHVTGTVGSRVFIYDFRLKVDITSAVKSDSLFLEIRLLEKKPEAPVIRPPAIIPGRFKGSSKRLERKSQSIQQVIQNTTFSFRRSEITDVIPNTEASAIVSNRIPFTRAVKVVPRPTINAALYQLPMTSSLPPAKSVSLASIAPTFIKAQSDPAQIVSFRNSPPAALRSLPKAKAMLAKNVMFRKPKIEKPPVIFTIFLGSAELERKLFLRESVLKSKSNFYLEAKLKNDAGVTIAKAGVIVPHAKILNDFMTPEEPPELIVSQISSGEMSVGVTQIDKKATRIKVFRRIAPSENNNGTPWSLILDEDLEAESGEIRFRDRIASSSAIMYRAVCLGENSRIAERFASKVITPRQETKIDFSGKGTALAVIENSSIRISVTDFPSGAVTVGLRRYNLTLNSYSKFQAQEGKGFVSVPEGYPNEQRQFITSVGDTIQFYDSPKAGSIYKYVPITYTKYGKEILGKPAIIDFVESQEDSQKVAMSVGKAILTSGKSSNSVSFSLRGKFTDFGFEEVSSVLANAEQAGLFASNVATNRDKFSSLIVFLVERENTITGEVETFGIQETDSFVDNATSRSANNVKDFAPGTRYHYKVTACIRPADSLFPDLAKVDVDIGTLSSFSRSIQKFRGPLQLRKSTLASTARQLNSSVPSALEPIDPFIAGRTSVQAVVEVMIPASTAKGSHMTVEKRMTNNLIKWSYAGDMDKIDHFQVFLTSGGGYELLGTVHIDKSSMNFSYRHFVSETIPFDTNYSYMVKPINIAFKEQPSLKTITIVANQFPGISRIDLSRAAKVIQR